MTAHASSDDPRPAARRARDAARLAKIFGDTLPETTSDERGEEPGDARSADDWLRAQVPPHHG
ncbi:hypothetical protein [Nocardia pneumoniae]|uniref:hypothetical protein n=1 Tax=Nocardia pneumoniae TaxID=228601 RepID=UPI000A049E00|nr:hypothetical protein [Nocardia pneumoniae]